MALSETILEIAEDMEKDSKDLDDGSGKELVFLLRSYAKQLRVAVKASGENRTYQTQKQAVVDPSYQNFLMIEEAKQKLREEKKAANSLLSEEGLNPGMVFVVGGNSDGVYVSVDPKMPVGAKTMLGEDVYVLHVDHKLRFSDKDTEEMRVIAKQ